MSQENESYCFVDNDSHSAGAGALPQHCSIEKRRTEQYYNYLTHSRNNSIPVFQGILFGTTENVAVLLEMKPELLHSIARNKIYRLAKKEWDCKTCADRIQKMSLCVASDGNTPVCSFVHASRNELQKELCAKCDDLIKSYIVSTKGHQWNYKIVRSDTLYADRASNIDEQTGMVWRHYSWVPTQNSEALADHRVKDGNTLELLEKALNKYCPMMMNLFDKIGVNADLLASMVTVKQLLAESSYGKQQIPAVDWFIKHISNLLEIRPDWHYLTWLQKVDVVIKAICDCSLSIADDDSGDVLCGLWHTVSGNVLDLLEKGETPKAVVAMIEMRNDPRNYKQTTAAPKAVHIEKARNLFKGFTATIHTTAELEQLEGCATVRGNAEPSNDVDDAFSGMAVAAAAKKKKSSRYSGFASRMNSSSDTHPTNMRELMDSIRSGSVRKLELIPPHSTVYTAKWYGENIIPADFCVPHLWIFTSDGRWNSAKYYEITHVYRMKTRDRENYHFIIKNARDTLYSKPLKGNCTLKEFLATKHQKTAGNAFHALKNTTNVQIPRWDQLSLGVGTSVDKGTSLMSTLQMKINGKLVTISHSGF